MKHLKIAIIGYGNIGKKRHNAILKLNQKNVKVTNIFDKNFISYFLSFFILTSVVLLLINQPDFGQSVLIVSTWLSLIFISGIKVMYLVLIGIFVLSLSILIFFLFPEKFGYIIYRLLTFLDPSSGDNFQNEKALEAIKLGGLKGQGMGEGILKDSVPEAHTDYIIAIISEEFGSILSIMIVLIFLYISYRVIKICIKEENEFIVNPLECDVATATPVANEPKAFLRAE